MQNMTHDEYSTPVHLFGSHLTLRDFINVAPTATTLNRIHGELQSFIRQSIFNAQPVNAETMSVALSDTIVSLRHYFNVLEQYELPDYDARASVEQLIRTGLPTIINLIEEDTSEEFGIRILRELITFTRRLFSVLVTTIGQQNTATYLNRIVHMTIPFFNGPLRVFQRYIESAILNSLNALILDAEDVQQFLVIRRPPPPPPVAAPTVRYESEPNLRFNFFFSIQPMETDEIPLISAPTTQEYERLRETLETPPLAERNHEDLPAVNAGTEAWHSHFPTQWLPIITRDIEVQRSDKVRCYVFLSKVTLKAELEILFRGRHRNHFRTLTSRACRANVVNF